MSENFSELLKKSEISDKKIRYGMKLTAKIVGSDESSVFVDIGAKIDGYVEKDELLDAEGKYAYKNGDELELYVVSNKESEIRLSKALSGDANFGVIRDAFERNIPVSAKVKSQVKGGFEVTVMGKRAFCPISHIDIKKVEKPEEYIGGVYNFKIITCENNGKNIVLSRQPLLREEQKAVIEKLLAGLENVDTVSGKVTKLADFGAFVDIGGVEGLIHISELSWVRVKHASEVVKVGDTLKVKILKIEKSDDQKPPKISLSLKQLSEHPWLSIENKFKIGDRVTGKVTRVMEFGAFVEVLPGIEGLVHISELSAERRVNRVSEVMMAGDLVEVAVIGIDMERKKLSLSLKEIQKEELKAKAAEEEAKVKETVQAAAPAREPRKKDDENDWRKFTKVGVEKDDDDSDANPFKKLADKFKK